MTSTLGVLSLQWVQEGKWPECVVVRALRKEVLGGRWGWTWGQQERAMLNLGAEVRAVCPDEEV